MEDDEEVVRVNEFKPEDMPLSCTWLVIGAPASGKCMGIDTPITMMDGSIKMVQDVKNGDIIMGDDLQPRNVWGVTSGTDRLYKIQHQNSQYIVNSCHILTLFDKFHGKLVDIELKRFLLVPLDERSRYMGARVDKTTGYIHYIEITGVYSKGRGQYFGFCIDKNRRFILGDGIITHNTTFIENMAYYRKHIYPVAKVFIGTEDNYQRFKQIFGEVYTCNRWDKKEEERHIVRQRKCALENRKGAVANHAINILDDIGDDPKIFKQPIFGALFKLGSQHWDQLLMVGIQYAIDAPPAIRDSVSYVAIGRMPEENQRKKIYNNFGGICGSYEKFCRVLDALTGDFTFLIIKRRSQSNKLEDNIFYYRTKQLPMWKFGCEEYKAWNKKRYNKNYKDTIVFGS